jgi:hypothetical protein
VAPQEETAPEVVDARVIVGDVAEQERRVCLSTRAPRTRRCLCRLQPRPAPSRHFLLPLFRLLVFILAPVVVLVMILWAPWRRLESERARPRARLFSTPRVAWEDLRGLFGARES